jgi:predicted TIM-barrel fold metal-dependent hydrolase
MTNQPFPLKIDAYTHIVPPKYKEVLRQFAPKEHDKKIVDKTTLWNLEERFKVMDHFGEIVQVISLGWPSIEEIADPIKAVELCQMVNNELAELVYTYPHRFVAGIAEIPMNNIEAALKELDRAIVKLRLRGVQIHTPVNDKPLDLPEFWPIYEKMEKYDLPIFLHPVRSEDYPDYRTEKESKYRIAGTWGWPYETTAAMTRLVFSGILEKFPGLKLVTHHCGGMLPFFCDRITQFVDLAEMRGSDFRGERYPLTKAPIDYFKKFYADTALYGNTPGLMCGYSFFGPDHLIFGIDMPLGDTALGYRNYRQTINAIEAMSISEADKKKIYEENARKLMRLTV